MIDFRRSRKIEINWSYFSNNGSILLTILMAIFYVKSSSEIELYNHIECSESKTCTKCTNETSCSWSIEKQMCANTKQMSAGGMTVHNVTHCPRFTVAKRSSIVDEPFKYTVRISNDVLGFVTLLRNSKITCCLESCYFGGSVVDNQIVCQAIRTPSSYFSRHAKAMISYVYVTFDDLELKLDNGTDYYYTIYNRECSGDDDDDINCVTCLWIDDRYRYYLKWCSSVNRCMGPYNIYEKRVMSDNKKFQHIEDDVRIKCPDIEIRSIEPMSVLWAGGTTMSITVRNHWILVENQTVTVTVAGRNCANPKTFDHDTITCTVTSPSITAAKVGRVSEGPVRVVYASPSTKFTVQSTATVSFVEPEITEVSPVCGPTDGGTLLVMHGKFLDTGGYAVRMSVGNVPCESLTQRHATSDIACWTGPSDTAASEVVHVELVQRDEHHRPSSVLLKIYGPIFTYVGDPMLNAGQSFDGIVPGGVEILVRGHGFTAGCGNDIVNATFYVDDRDGIRHHASSDCRVVNDSCMACRTPRLPWPTRGVPSFATFIAMHDFGVTVAIRRQRWLRHFVNITSPDVIVDETLDLSPQSSNLTDTNTFIVYPEPSYAYFETDSNDSAVIIIYGRGVLGRGYRPSDVTVRFENSTTDGCVVISMSRRRIVCRAMSVATANIIPAYVRSVFVSVGDGFAYRVNKKSADHHNNNYTLKLLATASSCGFVVVIVIVLSIIGVLMFRLKKKNLYVVHE